MIKFKNYLKYSSLFFLIFLFAINLNVDAQTYFDIYKSTDNTRYRVIIDNDFGSDPDGLFQLAHQLLSPTVDVKAIIGSKHYKNGFYGSSGSASYACELANELLDVMNLKQDYTVIEGGNTKLPDINTSIETDAAKMIIKEAMLENTKQPLYIGSVNSRS